MGLVADVCSLVCKLSGGWPHNVDAENMVPLKAHASYEARTAEFSLNFFSRPHEPGHQKSREGSVNVFPLVV